MVGFLFIVIALRCISVKVYDSNDRSILSFSSGQGLHVCFCTWSVFLWCSFSIRCQALESAASLKQMEALVPPNPKLLVSANLGL